MSTFEVTEADEASCNKPQALANLRSIYLDNGPGNLTDMYERAAWRHGADRLETASVLRNTRRLRHTQLLTAVYNATLEHGAQDPRTQWAATNARGECVPELEILTTIENASQARSIANRVNQSLGLIAYRGLELA